MTQSRTLVLAVVSLALIAYTGMVVVLASRKGGKAWRLLCWDVAFAWLKTAGWLGLIFEAPQIYDHIPYCGWVILLSQLAQSFVMWKLAFAVLGRTVFARLALCKIFEKGAL